MLFVHFGIFWLMFVAAGIFTRLVQGWLGDSKLGAALAYSH